MKRALLVLVISACTTPTPQIKLKLSQAKGQACPDACSAISLPCDAVMSIRIIDDHADPAVRLLDQCTAVAPDLNNDACSLNRIELANVAIPVRELTVQLAVFPGAQIVPDKDGKLVCPDVEFTAADGLPVLQANAPVIGGQAYYHPGDSVVEVTLGCTDLSTKQAGKSCKRPLPDAVVAAVDDFETRAPVTAGPQGVAGRLFVSVGEPHLLDGGYVLTPRDATRLKLDDGDPANPRWVSPEEPEFVSNACVEVLDDLPQSIASLRCAPAGERLDDLRGMWIKRERLRNIVASLGFQDFPDEGITIGMVVDGTASGVANYTVKPNGAGSVVYLADNDLVGGSATSSTGIFVSRDAPFGTMFSATGMKPTVPAIGGLVAGKVTVVLVPFAPPQ